MGPYIKSKTIASVLASALTFILTIGFSLMAVSPQALAGHGDKYPTLPSDGIAWEFGRSAGDPAPNRVILIGDLHGNLQALLTILMTKGIINAKGDWIAPAGTALVFDGDFIDGKPYGKQILDVVMKIQGQALRKGSRVHVNLGNHEILAMLGQDKDMTRAEALMLAEGDDLQATGYQRDTNVRNALNQPDSIYAKWLVQQNMYTGVANLLMVHAGIDDWNGAEGHLDRINATARAWLKWGAGLGPKPPPETSWVIGINKLGKFQHDLGPAFLRFNRVELEDDQFVKAARPEGPSRNFVAKTLTYLGYTSMGVGHTPTHDFRVHMHPYYGNLVNVVDTAMAFGGDVSCLEYTPSTGRIFTWHDPGVQYAPQVAALMADLTKGVAAIEAAAAVQPGEGPTCKDKHSPKPKIKQKWLQQ
jgi:hypothetical protein